MKNRDQYPENWEDTIRPEILKRDNYKCTICGVKHRSIGYYDHAGIFIECDTFMQKWARDQGYNVNKIHLQIAHLNHAKNDCRPENLKSMCPKCHLNNDREFNMLKRKLPGRQTKRNF